MTADLSKKLDKTISSLAFGVMQFGGKADAPASRRMYDMARDAGITLFDAAFVYTDGGAETLLGEFAAGERDDVVLISKCGYKPGMRRAELETQVRTSLRRLRVDHADILYLHRYPGDDLLRDSLECMRDLHAAGAFTLLGVSNFAAWQVMKAQALAAEIGAPRIDILQPMYNLVKRQAEVEMLPMALTEGFAVHSYSPLGGGLLTGKYATGGTGRLSEDQRYADRYQPGWMHATAGKLVALARETGLQPEALAVAWAAAHPGVSAPIISASRPEQMAAPLAAAAVEMTTELYDRIAALSPTPAPATDRLEEA